MTDPLAFIHALTWEDLPPQVQRQTRLCLLDLLGVAAGGLGTRLSGIVHDHAAEDWPGDTPMLFDARSASLPGAALAAAMTIDSLDGHDGYNPAKGHIGCPLIPPLLLIGHARGISGKAFLTALAMGYEFGARAATAQHATCPDYHTSGSWGAVTAAAGAARLMGLSPDQTRHALGIAEYHGPRSQMMRCIDHPTMVKDGSGWGAMAGVSAAQLAARGFTGAPAITVEAAPEFWADLGHDWRIAEQYFKPWPVCRWAQGPVEAVLALRARHQLRPEDVTALRIDTFHEATRLASARPDTTEEAQYSTSFPCAVALARGDITPADIDGAALHDPEILRLSAATSMFEDAEANALFPGKRLARVTLTLTDGREVTSDWTEPRWSADTPPRPQDLHAKYRALATPVLGEPRSAAIFDAVETLADTPLRALTGHLLGVSV
ncbi:MmgE/PrpD family protein [Aestuariicoccus sp. MJ-SS9]|uniref:MmgE/PrpD family protein n=1 Tax=Aestuariicoccus sp. MJ-SS9 TaxID=3079855 RepID=UPI0029129DEF|nr:MmgE/PrpD family protein [Aestuariicoccus sp. MJ-SS9]MDU8910530.1 MmgE/PrpD family protein [Aestuariicoccus sp. MJ-SS9]